MLSLDAVLRLDLPRLDAGLRSSVPVDPDAETARRWAVEELARPEYNERPNLGQLALEWARDQLARLIEAFSGADPRAAWVTVVVVLVVVGLVALLVAGPVRRARARSRGSAEVFGDDVRTTAELRASADRLAAEGRWAEAVLDRFRAVLRSLEDRALLDDRPGRTAHEAAEQAAGRLPTCADDLRRAGRLFDDVCYGHLDAGPDDDAWLREVDQRVTAARPDTASVAVAGAEVSS